MLPTRPSLALLLLVAAACANAAPPVTAPASGTASGAAVAPAPAPTEPPDDPLPALRTGSLEPEEVPGVIDLRVVARHAGDGYESFEATGPDALAFDVAVDAPAGQPMPYAFTDHEQGRDVVWIRRPASEGPVTGSLYSNAALRGSGGTERGTLRRFRLVDPHAGKSSPAVHAAWLRALRRAFDRRSARSLLSVFARDRLGAMADAIDPPSKPKPTTGTGARRPIPVRVQPPRPQPRDELAELMETTTGTTAVQEALQHNRTLLLATAKEPATIPLASLDPPPLALHPWAAMRAALPASGSSAPSEPLAAAAPAEFYFVRAADPSSLFRLLDEVDAWGTAAADALDGRSEERDVSARYEAQLGLRRSVLTRALGPAVLGQVGVVGSDPYLREGSDVTVMLGVRNRALLDAALAATLAEYEQTHGALARETREHGGVKVSVARSADGAVRQQRARVGDLELVSNCAPALDTVLDAIQGRHGRLADEPDFRFMVARDPAERADVLAYMGDGFVAEVVGAKQKVLEARREIALGELMTPGLAALLYGWMQGKAPGKAEDLFAAGLLAKSELTHASGAPIAWTPGSAARSTWGTPAAMTPLYELSVPRMVTASEKASYERFARTYQYEWQAYIDPIALRFAFDDQSIAVSMRELPVIDGTKYRDVAELAGDARFRVRPLASGARLVGGIGAESDVRRDATRAVRGLAGHEITFDWVGDWFAVGTMDRTVLAQAYLALADADDVPEMPSGRHPRKRDAIALVGKLPLYAEIAVRSTAQAAIAIAAVRAAANETIPGMFEWGEWGRHRDVPIVRVALGEKLTRELDEGSQEIDVYYAVTEGALLLALQPWVIERLIDEQIDGTGATSRGAGASDPQLAFDIASDPGKAITTTLGWLLDARAQKASRGSTGWAEALLRGSPEAARDSAAARALGIAYFGAVPVTGDGTAFGLTPQGVSAPPRGTEVSPVWPAVPVPGSPVARILQSLRAVRTSVGFDDEGKDKDGKPMRSLHVRASFATR
jgi:hypothetical protein